MEISDRKKLLRSFVMEKRKRLAPQEIKRESAKAMEQLLQTREYFEAQVIFSYVSFRQELSTIPVIKAALLDGKAVAVPKVRKEDAGVGTGTRSMEFYQIWDISELKPGYLGILEPDGEKPPKLPDENTLMLLPGLSFDRAGNRLGYGGGFYDTYIEKCRQAGTVPILAGYSYDFQIFQEENFLKGAALRTKCENSWLRQPVRTAGSRRDVSLKEVFGGGKFPAQEHDQRMDMVVTPSEIIYTGGQKD